MKTPFGYFGNKTPIAPAIWQRLGDPTYYYEPFAGSLGCLLARPSPGRYEYVGDIDAQITNFWRAAKWANLSNLPLGEIASLRALATRLNPAEFNPTEGEKRALMWKIAEGGKFGLHPEACEEVCEYLVFHAGPGKPLDLRLLDNAFNDRLMYDRGESRTHWKDLVASRIDAQIVEPTITPRTRQARLLDERDIAKQIYDKYPDSHQRADRDREWKERVGKSERALYRRLADLGLEPYPKYMSTEDLQDLAQESVNPSTGTV